MILNALDEVLFWEDIDVLKSFIIENKERYYPHDPKSFYIEKDKFLWLHIPTKEKFLSKLEHYSKNGSPTWISSRNCFCDDIGKNLLLKAINVNVSSKIENGREKAMRASEWQTNDSDFWGFYSDSILYNDSNLIFELTIGAGGGTNAIMKNMGKNDYYIGADIDFVCAKNADAMANYYGVNGLGISTSLWNLPFEDGMFTSICSNAGLEECREIPTILSEAVRVLAPKGKIIIRCIRPNKNTWYSYFEKYGLSFDEANIWLRKIRFCADILQVKELLWNCGLKCIDQKDDKMLGSIIVFEK